MHKRTLLKSAAAALLAGVLTPVSAAEPVIILRVNGETIRIQMNSTPEARAFLAKLPVKVRMGEFGGREFYGPLGSTLPSEGSGQYTFEDGTLTWCPTNDTVAVFYSQSDRPRLSMAVYPMGKVISDLSVFRRLGHSAVFEFSRE